MQNDWTGLIYKVSDLGPKPGDGEELNHFLDTCNRAAQPATCMQEAFRQSTVALNARLASWQAEVTNPGDPKQALKKIQAIEGRYKHSFLNGDVQGHTFHSTDWLQIDKASDTSVRYSLQLAFYNGHECSRKGVASYKQGSMFTDKTEFTPGQICVFEIVPTATGVKLADPTGMCRQSDCGERGGYNGTSFLYSERTAIKPTKARDRAH